MDVIIEAQVLVAQLVQNLKGLVGLEVLKLDEAIGEATVCCVAELSNHLHVFLPCQPLCLAALHSPFSHPTSVLNPNSLSVLPGFSAALQYLKPYYEGLHTLSCMHGTQGLEATTVSAQAACCMIELEFLNVHSKAMIVPYNNDTM